MIPRFRVWEPYYKKMFTNDQIIIWNGNVYVNDADKITVDNMRGWSIDDKYLMQSTGLFDVNGKEIFEGDVVRLGSRYILVVKYGRHYIECKPNAYRGIGFFLITKDLPNPKYPVFPDGEYEVIGNVHQNPELLEVLDEK